MGAGGPPEASAYRVAAGGVLSSDHTTQRRRAERGQELGEIVGRADGVLGGERFDAGHGRVGARWPPVLAPERKPQGGQRGC
jgi:hypothetical protein